MPTTSNFGWTTPADTDLVKDGAAAIRTLGNGIDSSLVDLKGGTTGQNLRKASNTDLDFTFAGDATNTVVDAAGDLLYGTANDTLGRLAIGTAGQVLKVNSGATAPEWGAAPAASFVGCLATTNGTQTLANATETIVTFATEEYDTDGFHSTVTNTGRITIPTGKGGKYLFTLLLRFASNATGQRNAKLFKNGAELPSLFRNILGGTSEQIFTASWQMNLNATDYIEIKALQSSGGNLDLEGQNSQCQFGCIYLGA